MCRSICGLKKVVNNKIPSLLLIQFQNTCKYLYILLYFFYQVDVYVENNLVKVPYVLLQIDISSNYFTNELHFQDAKRDSRAESAVVSTKENRLCTITCVGNVAKSLNSNVLSVLTKANRRFISLCIWWPNIRIRGKNSWRFYKRNKSIRIYINTKLYTFRFISFIYLCISWCGLIV